MTWKDDELGLMQVALRKGEFNWGLRRVRKRKEMVEKSGACSNHKRPCGVARNCSGDLVTCD